VFESTSGSGHGAQRTACHSGCALITVGSNCFIDCLHRRISRLESFCWLRPHPVTEHACRTARLHRAGCSCAVTVARGCCAAGYQCGHMQDGIVEILTCCSMLAGSAVTVCKSTAGHRHGSTGWR
jgi:hypothetical protein